MQMKFILHQMSSINPSIISPIHGLKVSALRTTQRDLNCAAVKLFFSCPLLTVVLCHMKLFLRV